MITKRVFIIGLLSIASFSLSTRANSNLSCQKVFLRTESKSLSTIARHNKESSSSSVRSFIRRSPKSALNFSGRNSKDVAARIEDFILKVEMKNHSRNYLDESGDIFKEVVVLLRTDIEARRSTYLKKSKTYDLVFEQVLYRIISIQLDATGARYPYEPTIHLLKDLRKFYLHLDEKESSTVATRKANGRIVSTDVAEKSIRKVLERHNHEIRKIIEAPDVYYKNANKRLKEFGGKASFPEFESAFSAIRMKLLSAEIFEIAVQNPLTSAMREDLFEILSGIRKKRYPYQDSLNAMERSLAFFDILQRTHDSRLSELFHSVRWQYYASLMKAQQPGYIIIPTFLPLKLTDFIKVRGIPVGLVGLSFNATYADTAFMSPLEFWFHDLNHSRRMWQQYADRAKELGMSIESYAEISHKFITEEIIPAITILPKDDKNTVNLKKLSQVIVFEVSHERALPLDREMLIYDLSLKALSYGRFISETLTHDLSKVIYTRNNIGTVLSVS